MLIDTIFEPKAKVWAVVDNSLREGILASVNILAFCEKDIREGILESVNISAFCEKDIRVVYQVCFTHYGTITFESNRIFKTKEDAVKAWLKAQGLECGLVEDNG